MRRVLLAVVAAAGAVGAFLLAGRFLVVTDPLPRGADAIIILAGSLPDRVLEAADLYHAGIAPRVVVTREQFRRAEPALRARGIYLAESDQETLAALHRLGVPEGATRRLVRRNTSTESEAETIARWACGHRLRRLVVVTSKAHSRRARMILARALGPTVAFVMRPSRHDHFKAARWWRDRRDAKTVLDEYEKVAHFWMRERWTIPPCGGLRRR